MMGPCAKQRVVAIATIKNAETIIVGENLCLKPQATCPRAPGEAYAKCYTHCAQVGHAEETLLRQILVAGIKPSDVSSIHVFGHTGPCDNCRSLLDVHGLLAVTKFYPSARPAVLRAEQIDNIAAAYNLTRPSSHSRHAIDVRVLASQ